MNTLNNINTTIKMSTIRPMKPMFQEILKLKDEQVDDLRYEAARLRKAHDDLLATYEAKLAKLGVPREELGFK